MQKYTISSNQQIFLIFMFVLGSSLVFGVNTTAQNDGWISIILATLFILPIVCIYARILKLFPEKSIFDIIQILFGKIFGKILIALITWYAIHLSAVVVRNFSEYVGIIAMPEVPPLVVMICLLLVTMYLAKSNIRTLGEWAIIAGTIVTMIVALTIVLEIKDMKYTNILPIMANGFKPILVSSFQIFSFPFAETILFLALGGSIKQQKDSPYKIFMIAILLSSVIMLGVFLRNLFVLGAPMCKTSYFPSFTASRLIKVGDFLSRIEGSISVNLILAGITKITICLICASKGIAKLFDVENYQNLVLCTSLLVLALCVNLYKNVMQIFDFIKYYPYYTFIFQVIIPITIWLVAEYHNKKNKKIPAQTNSEN